MIMVATVIVATLFSLFVFLDILSVLPRVSGSIVGRNGVAYSFQVMVNTLKRVFLVLYPPVMGLIAVTGSLEDMFAAVFFSYGLAAVAILMGHYLRYKVVNYFCDAIDSYANGRGLFRSLWSAKCPTNIWIADINSNLNVGNGRAGLSERYDFKILTAALWIFFFYSASIFLINILGFVFKEYSSVILQMTGFANAMGTIALAFYLDPKLSRLYEKSTDLPKVVNSLILAHILNICLLSPVFFASIYYAIA